MKKLGLVLVILAVGLLFYGSLATAQPAHSLALSAVNGKLLTATLLGANEVPPIDTAATGFANFVVADDEICYEISVTAMTDASAAHIHTGAAGVNGDPLVNLTPPDANGESSGCTTVPTGDITAILANPAGFYVNVHTPANPGGEIRGQLEAVPVLVAQLNGLNELAGGAPYQGDLDGTGSAVVSLYEDQGLVCYEFAFLNIASPTAAHIHSGDVFSNGPVVVNFTQIDNSVLNEGCAEATPTVIGDILEDSTEFYVNVHNADFPGGAIRGQLWSDAPLSAAMNGANEFPNPGDADGTGMALLNFNVGNATVCGALAVDDVDTPTAGHIHTGAVGASGSVLIDLEYTGSNAPFCVTADRQTLVDIITNPTAFYVNVHNAEFGAGAVRGQLFDMVPFNVVLDGQNETSGGGNFGVGDPDGAGVGLITISPVQERICYLVQVNNINQATAAHIHSGTFDENGPVMVTLQTPDGGGFSSQCEPVDTTDETTASYEILVLPDEYYVNVHTADFPGGAVRDQLTLTQTIDLGDAGAFALSAPKNNTYIRDAGNPISFEWSDGENATSYTLTLFQISSNARLGLIDMVTSPAAEICAEGVCTLEYDPSVLETGTYSWTVKASSLDGDATEASNAAFLFKLNVDPIELVKNGGFEDPVTNPDSANPANWKRVNPSGERRECRADKLPANVSGVCAYKGTGGPLATLTQNVAKGLLNKLRIAPGDTLTVNASVQAANPVPAKSKVRILIQFAGGKKQTINVPLDAANGDVFAAITPKSTEIGQNKAVVKKLTVQVVSGSKFFIDDVSVILEPVEAAPPIGIDNTLIPVPGSPSGDLRGQ